MASSSNAIANGTTGDLKPPSGVSSGCLPGKSEGEPDGALEGLPLPHHHPSLFHGKGSFPLNLTLMLESVERMGLGHVVSWSPDGKTFAIHDPEQFLDLVLPKFFK